MADAPEQYKRLKSIRKKQPVRSVSLSDDARRAYEALMQEREVRDRDYGRHLASPDNKAK